MRISSKIITTFLVVLIFIAGGIFCHFFQRSEKKIAQPEIISSKFMKIESSAFSNNQFIPAKYTCDGEDINPPLKISEVPKGAKSLVLIVDDPDAPMGTWLHWTVWNISPEIEEIPENNVPEGAVEGITDFGKLGYGGPCPPSGIHRYFFKLYALDKSLELESSAKSKDIEKAMEGYILDQAQLIGMYSR